MLMHRVREVFCLEELGGVSTDRLRGDLTSVLTGVGKRSWLLGGVVDCDTVCSNHGTGGALLASLTGANGLHRCGGGKEAQGK